MPTDPFPIGGETREEMAERLRVEGVWQRVMATEDGRLVLSAILRDLGLFTPVSGERMAGRHEAAILLMERMQRANAPLCMTIISELLTNDDAQE